jgi:hypothetical protein
MIAIVVFELAFLLYMMVRRIPTWIDNGYRHENRADNVGSLRRVPHHEATARGPAPATAAGVPR